MNEIQSKEQVEADMLDVLIWDLEKEISNYELEVIEDLYHEELDQVVKRIRWSRGDKTHEMVISPYGQICAAEKRTPTQLMMDVSNRIVWSVTELFDQRDD